MTQTLSAFIRSLQASGRYTFTHREATVGTQKSAIAVSHAILRLIRKKAILRARRGFFVIVPTEYLHAGAPPPTWYVDQLMQFHKQDYYVGLLSAAALHGAAHQQPQEFQVITTKPLRPIRIARTYITFSVKKEINSNLWQPVKTPTGYIKISTPEMTAFDLIKYIQKSGDINHVATVLSELIDEINVQSLAEISMTNIETASIQRLGFLLEYLGYEHHADALKGILKNKLTKRIPLRIGISYDHSQFNRIWDLYINVTVEVDE